MKPNVLKNISRSFSVMMIFALLFSSRLVDSVHAAPGDITRVSVDSSGVQANDYSAHPAISADGRFIAFESAATNLAGGTGGIFLKDRQTGITTRVAADGSNASISDDGRFIAFDSTASNIVSGDTNGMTDIFVYDRQSGITARASVDSSGAQSDNASESPAISGNGRFVAFRSDATNLISSDTNALGDIFVHDLQTDATERISIATDGTQANAGAFDESISSDGHMVVFSSNATNLVDGDTNGAMDIFARDRQTGITTRVSVNSSGVEANRGAGDSSVSGNGRFVSFSSFSTNLMTQDSWEFMHIYVRDLQAGTTTLASATSDGTPMIERSEQSVLSADGRFVAFQFDDKGDGQALWRIYVIDRQTGARNSSGGSWSGSPAISADGRFVAFASDSSTLVSGDTNGVTDVFVSELSFTPDLVPTVLSVQRLCAGGGGCAYPTPSNVSFRVTFSELVSGVAANDFILTSTGGISGATVTDVSGSNNVYNVAVNTGSGDGTLRLDVVDDDSIKDFTQNPLGGMGASNGNFNKGEVIVVDKNAPTVTGITRLDPDSNGQGVHYAVSFSESVTGVDSGDFSLASTGWISGAYIMDVTGSGSLYTITVDTGIGDGTLRLDLIDNDSIFDTVSLLLGGAGTGNGNFTFGEIYSFERNMPVIKSITRMDANPSIAQSVNYLATFSEPVNGVDVGDFALTANGIPDASIIAVNGSGSTYAVTVATGSGNGSLRLDLIDNDSILDLGNNPLGNVGIGGIFPGETYNINKATRVYTTTTFRSSGTNDGWILESNENSNVGGTTNASASTINLGDSAQDKQYRAILHFPTQGIPDNAVVTRAILTLKRKNIVGNDPFTTHQNIQIDIVTGNFGFDSYLGSYALQPLDFQAPSTLNAVGAIQNNPVGDVYWALLSGDANRLINLRGITQLRLEFQLDDNDDMSDDFVRFYSGDASQIGDRPHLEIEYYVLQ